MTLQNPRCYVATIGTTELRFWGDDRRARVLVSRWVRRNWRRVAAATIARCPGSIAANMALDSTVSIYRYHYSPVRGVAGCGMAKIESYDAIMVGY